MQNQNSNFIMDIVNLPFTYSLQLHFSKVQTPLVSNYFNIL